jgi:signal transduction histidine kinase
MKGESHRTDLALLVLLGLAALVVPVLAGCIVFHQSRIPMLGAYLSESNPPVVTQVLPGGTGASAGLNAGDVILAVNHAPYAAWRNKGLGQTVTLDITRAGRPLTLTAPMASMLAANRLQLAIAVLVALMFWGVGILLLWRTRRPFDVRLLFCLFQAIAVYALPTLAYPRFWVPYGWMVSLQFAGLYLAAPLFLHYHLTFPVMLGSPRQRRWVLVPLYSLAAVSMVDAWSRAVPWSSWAIFCMLAEAAVGIGLIVFVYFRRATSEGRRRLRVVVAGTVVGLALPMLGYVLPTAIMGYTPDIPRWLVGLCAALVPLSYLYATLRHNLFGIDRLLNRTMVYGILSAGIFALYAGPALGLDRLVSSNWLGHTAVLTGATLLVALAFEQTRTRAQRLVDRLFYGGWYDYAGVVEQVSDALARSLEWHPLADILTHQVPALMQLCGAQSRVAEQSTAPLDAALQPQLRFPLNFEGKACGVWIVGPRRDGQDFSDTDRRILKTLAREADIAVSNMLLVKTLRDRLDEIRASRETLMRVERQLLRTREEERARLARDLHDGPVQSLIGLNMQLGMLMQGTPPVLNTPLVEAMNAMRGEVKGLLSELRAVCAELRPPLLDTLGLGAALRTLANEWSAQQDIAVHIELPPDAALRSLPGEVAVNLYRIVQEALSNVARHASARQVALCLTCDSAASSVELSVRDDGQGFEPAALHPPAGSDHLGLLGMQERAALIGGEWKLESAPGQGTTVSVFWQRNDKATRRE